MIGTYDDTGLIWLFAPITYKNVGGSNPAAFNTGKASFLYRGASAGGSEYGTLTNCAAGYGYTTDGVFLGDGANDYINMTNMSGAWNSATSKSFFARIYFNTATTYDTIFGTKTATNLPYFYFEIYSTGVLVVLSRSDAGAGATTVATSTTVSLGAWHTIGVVQDTTTIKIYLDGVECAYSAHPAYNITSSYTQAALMTNIYNTAYSVDGKFAWAAFYDNARSAANITADHTNAATFYGLVGVNDAPGTDEVFDSLTAPGSTALGWW